MEEVTFQTYVKLNEEYNTLVESIQISSSIVELSTKCLRSGIITTSPDVIPFDQLQLDPLKNSTFNCSLLPTCDVSCMKPNQPLLQEFNP